MEGKLLVFSGPSGAGKGTILHKLIEGGGYAFSVSMTTRAPREGEVDGVDYFFVSEEKFRQTIEEGGFLEYVHKFNRSYGTPKDAVLAMMAEGKNVILDIEMEGALNVKRMYPDAILIFVLPPSLEELHRRLMSRGTESAEQIAIRTQEIQKEIELLAKYDYYIVNDDLAAAVETARAIASGDGESCRVQDADSIIARYREEE